MKIVLRLSSFIKLPSFKRLIMFFNNVLGLIGIMPSGAITFVSELYPGSISDKELTHKSGLLQMQWDEGDSVMVDKGFLVEDYFR